MKITDMKVHSIDSLNISWIHSDELFTEHPQGLYRPRQVFACDQRAWRTFAVSGDPCVGLNLHQAAHRMGNYTQRNAEGTNQGNLQRRQWILPATIFWEKQLVFLFTSFLEDFPIPLKRI